MTVTTIDLVDQEVVRRRKATEAQETLERAKALAAIIRRCDDIIDDHRCMLPQGTPAYWKAFSQREAALKQLLGILK
jgi:hypothetical protein